MASELRAEDEGAHGVTAEAQGHLPALSVPTRRAGSVSHQPHPARMGALFRRWALEPLFLVCEGLGRQEGAATSDACPESSRLRVETVESAVAAYCAWSVQQLPSSPGVPGADSESHSIGPITLDAKQAGKRSAGNPLAPFGVAGAGNGALVRGCGQAYALQTVEPVTYRCGTRRVCQARSSGSERDTRARPHAVAPMNCVPEDSRRRSTCTGRTHSPRARADGHQTPSSTVAVRAPSPS